VNLLLQDDHVEYIINDAADDVLIVDRDAVATRRPTVGPDRRRPRGRRHG